MPVQPIWSRQIIWGNHRLTGGNINPTSNAWANNIVWGTARTGGTTGLNIVWGTSRGDDNIVWGTAGGDDNIVWGTARGDDNIVWGTDCGGADCDNVVWGSADGDDNIVWGTASGDDNIVWGTSRGDDNIVWGTSISGDFSWASDADDTTVFPPEDSEPLPSIDLEFGGTLLPTLVAPVTTTVTRILSIGGSNGKDALSIGDGAAHACSGHGHGNVDRLAGASAGPGGQTRHASPAEDQRRAVALRDAHDGGGVAVHLAAADERARLRALHRWTHAATAGSYACFAVTVGGTDTAIGIFQLRQLEPGFGSAEWGFAIGSAFWGTGVFKEGAELMVNFAFDVVGVHRLEARAAVRNGRGNGALRKVGAVQEGILRKSFLKDGEYLDQVLWTILEEDWRYAKVVWTGVTLH